jgi:hypothetical protein
VPAPAQPINFRNERLLAEGFESMRADLPPARWIARLESIPGVIRQHLADLHLVVGRHYRGPCPAFVNGYLIAILLPMQLYLLLGLVQNKRIRAPVFRARTVFGFGCFMEGAQFIGRPLFGATFAPYDFVAYAGGGQSSLWGDRQAPHRPGLEEECTPTLFGPRLPDRPNLIYPDEYFMPIPFVSAGRVGRGSVRACRRQRLHA